MASRIADYWLRSGRARTKALPRGEFMPVYVALGMILVSTSLGAYTVQEQLCNSPSVRVNKKRREIVPEVDEPERVAEEAQRYIKHSIFRKVANMQDFDAVRAGISDPTRDFKSPRVESLKSVGVEPKPNVA
ncbi:hypothetical protein IEQ34_007761 [Dendrobium chrysotoxum]|uniref:Uncharacterized protein n=1 Tax=Dendrobium chrysotoxum TaxID=161865 RepID=A0AAV7H520_DENCH|nr:hypothetical protein IEQ34_007761 [Dendrobium chrysotoxum]